MRQRSLGFLLAMVAAILVATAAVAIAALPPGGTFVDDDGNVHEPMIEAIAADGITEGCATNPSQYCPNDNVLRSEMAAMVVRGSGEAGNLPTYQGYFADVPAGQWYTPWVERLFELGLTEGCGTSPLRYCPDNDVRRDEMASFLGRAFGLDPIVPPTTTTTTTVPSGWSPLWPEDAGGMRDVEVWRPLVAEYWAADRVDCVLGIIYQESRGDPQAHNARSNAEGLMQHLLKYWDSRAAGAGFQDSNGLYASPYNAEANIAAGAYLASFYSTWYSPWSRTYDYGTCESSV